MLKQLRQLHEKIERVVLNAVWAWLRKHTYLTEDEIVEDLTRRLPEAEKERLREWDRGSLIAFHFTWGMKIRNTYRLWWAENPHTVLEPADDPLFPDQVSQRIIERVWERIGGPIPNHKNCRCTVQ